VRARRDSRTSGDEAMAPISVRPKERGRNNFPFYVPAGMAR
jgi:hypothetical protein